MGYGLWSVVRLAHGDSMAYHYSGARDAKCASTMALSLTISSMWLSRKRPIDILRVVACEIHPVEIIDEAKQSCGIVGSRRLGSLAYQIWSLGPERFAGTACGLSTVIRMDMHT